MAKQRKSDRERQIVLRNLIIITDMKELRFKHFARLKSGRDKYSTIRLPELARMVSKCDHEKAVKAFDHDKDIAVCLRWILRELPIDKAIRKVKTDLEITKNAIQAKRR